MSINGVSFIYVCHTGYSKRCTMATSYNHCISHLCQQKWYWQYCYHLLKMNFNSASTIFGCACWILVGLWNGIDSQSTYRLPLWAKMLLMLYRLPRTIECLRSIINICACWVSYTGMNCACCFEIELDAVSLINISLHTTSQICMQGLTCITFLACSYRDNM